MTLTRSYLFIYSSYIYATRFKTSRCYGYTVYSIHRLSDHICAICFYFIRIFIRQLFSTSAPSLLLPLSLPPSLADTVSVSRCVLGLSGWPLFLLHSFIIPRVRPSLYPLIFVQSVAKYFSNTSFVILVDRRRVADLPKDY